GLCDRDDPCTGPASVTKPKVVIAKLDTPPGDDKLTFKGSMTLPTSPAVDPVTKGVRVLIADSMQGSVLDATVPGGAFDVATFPGPPPAPSCAYNASGSTLTCK